MVVTRFAFGSGWRADQSQGHWEMIAKNAPQFWLWLGDNVFADTDDPVVMKEKYKQLADEPGYQKLIRQYPVLATWDDHDFGENDAGAENPIKKQSRELFLDFFDEPSDSARRKHAGVYTSYFFGEGEHRVQFILLDTRFFRSPLKRGSGARPYRCMGGWVADPSPEKTMLGDAQWSWLESELKRPSRIRFIVSSVQFAAPVNGDEAWGNFPNEKKRMVELIKKTKATGVVFLSGNIQNSEFCLDESPGCYPLFDHTSSSLNAPLRVNQAHRRLGPVFAGANFGVVSINWSPEDDSSDPTIAFATKDALTNETRLQHTLSLSDLNFENINPPFEENNFTGYWESFYGTMVIYKHPNNHWVLSTPTRVASLKLEGKQLVGSWRSSGKEASQKQKGACTFQLTRDGHFIKGAYSYGEQPQLLDWAAWRAPWAFNFNWKQ